MIKILFLIQKSVFYNTNYKKCPDKHYESQNNNFKLAKVQKQDNERKVPNPRLKIGFSGLHFKNCFPQKTDKLGFFLKFFYLQNLKNLFFMLLYCL